mmetsp:Transcript_23997/g.42992  ORF Transcript_23997/g.42992 Transcript_23997/m.42992 type:complete len:240 (-) Transcript_23997:48-767(-)
MILKTLSLIHHQIRILSNLIQPLLLINSHLITSNNHGKVWIFLVLRVERSGEHGIPFFGIAVEAYHGMGGEPFFEFAHPVWEGGEGGDDDEGAGDVHCAEMGDEADYLDGFSQSHLIRQNSTNPILIQTNQPPHTLQLIILQLTPIRQILRLDENRLPIGSDTLRIVFFLRGLEIGFSIRGFPAATFFAFLLLFGVFFGAAFFALFLAASDLGGGLGLHVGLEFVNVVGDEVGVFLGAA